jgi:predicted transcriptional regulator
MPRITSPIPHPVDPVVAHFARRRKAIGLSRSALSLLTHVSSGLLVRAEGGYGRPYDSAETERLEVVLSAIERARREAARLAGAA